MNQQAVDVLVSVSKMKVRCKGKKNDTNQHVDSEVDECDPLLEVYELRTVDPLKIF